MEWILNCGGSCNLKVIGLICLRMVKGPTYLGLNFLQGRRNLMSLVDSQTFCHNFQLSKIQNSTASSYIYMLLFM